MRKVRKALKNLDKAEGCPGNVRQAAAALEVRDREKLTSLEWCLKRPVGPRLSIVLWLPLPIS